MMNYEQSVEMAMSNNIKCYATVGGLYVSNVSLTYKKVSLAKDYKDAMDLCGLEHVEWLLHNVEDVKFFKIKVRAQSVPLTEEEVLGE